MLPLSSGPRPVGQGRGLYDVSIFHGAASSPLGNLASCLIRSSGAGAYANRKVPMRRAQNPRIGRVGDQR